MRQASGAPAIARVMLLGALSLAATRSVRAQGAPPDGWTFTGELTSVLSLGNARASTFGLGSTLEHRHGKDLLKLEAGGLRTESVIVTRSAVGTATTYEIRTQENRQKTAEMYFVRGHFDRTVSARVFLSGGLDWLRNTFAGIDSRALVSAGVGNTWVDTKQVRFRTSGAVTYTLEKDVVDNPAASSHFPGLRAGWDYWRQLTATTEFQSQLVGDENLDRTADVRADFTNSLSVAISSAFALKPSLQVLWRNRPSLARVPLVASDGTPLNQSVLAPLQKTDMLFRLALVVKL